VPHSQGWPANDSQTQPAVQGKTSVGDDQVQLGSRQ